MSAKSEQKRERRLAELEQAYEDKLAELGEIAETGVGALLQDLGHLLHESLDLTTRLQQDNVALRLELVRSHTLCKRMHAIAVELHRKKR